MSEGTVTCGDLALLGDPWDHLLRHDHRRQTHEDPHCLCWRDATPDDWVGGRTSPPDLPARLLEQHCRCPVRAVPEVGVEIIVCCRCWEIFDGIIAEVARSMPGGALTAAAAATEWLCDQAREALAYRDRRRLDSSPTIADMDLETAALMEDE